MSERREIIDGRRGDLSGYGLISTGVLSWVDLGHAQGTDIRKLLGLMAQGESSGRDYYDVTYSQGMTSPL